MGNTLSVTDDYYFSGAVRFKNAPIFPSGAIPSDAIKAFIDGAKIQGRLDFRHTQTGTIVTATEYLRIIRGVTATLLAVQAAITETIATGADRTVTIDLLKSTGAGAFASILGAPIVLNSVSTLRTAVQAALATPAMVAGDILKLTVAVAGAAGAQALGLVVGVDLKEDPA